MGGGDGAAGRLRDLPSVERLAASLDAPHVPAVAAARTAIDEERERLVAGADHEVWSIPGNSSGLSTTPGKAPAPSSPLPFAGAI